MKEREKVREGERKINTGFFRSFRVFGEIRV